MKEAEKRALLELSSADEIPRANGEPQTFYRYEAKGGKVVIVDSLSKLPPEERERAERLELGPRKPAERPAEAPAAPVVAAVPELDLPGVNLAPSVAASENTVTGQGQVRGSPHGAVDWTSFGLGLGAGLLVAIAATLLFGRGGGGFQRWALRATLFIGLLLVGSSAYLGWARGRAGLGDGALASPSDLLQDARGAVDQVKQRRAEQERQLEELKRLAK